MHDELGHPSLLVEQSYPFKSNKSSKDSSESDSPLASSTAWKEKTRYVNSQGNVIKILNNGKIEVLFKQKMKHLKLYSKRTVICKFFF